MSHTDAFNKIATVFAAPPPGWDKFEQSTLGASSLNLYRIIIFVVIVAVVITGVGKLLKGGVKSAAVFIIPAVIVALALLNPADILGLLGDLASKVLKVIFDALSGVFE